MKALNLFILLCLTFSFSYANENNATLDKYISDYKVEEFQYDYEKNEAEASKLRDSWIAPLRLNYSYSKSNPYIGEQTSQSASIRMQQPIFQSGGIYYGIKFAGASRLFNDYTTDSAKRKMIKESVSLLMQIKQYALKEKKQKLQISNSKINLEQKKEQYLSGQLDSGFLDDAIIQKNVTIEAMYDIQTMKEKLIAQFESLSDLEYTSANVPHLELITKEEFLKHNLSLKVSEATQKMNMYAKDVRVAAYLPSIDFTASYNWNKKENQQFAANIPANSEENDYYNYGLSVSIPLDINTFRDIESAKVDYLKSKVLKKDKLRELKALFKQVMQNIQNYDKKIALSHENAALYSKLLDDTKALYEAGYKTEYDVKTLTNSLEIQNIDSEIYEMDKQLELLTLYEMYISR
ncbi:TolC family protein [Sulfurimonas sp.]